MLGTWLARLVDLPQIFAIDVGGTTFPVVWSIVGSVLFVALLGLVLRGTTAGRRHVY